jgi:hypothetical protein
MNPNGSRRRFREQRTWESGEEVDVMGGVEDLTLLRGRQWGVDGAATGPTTGRRRGGDFGQGEGCEMRESGDLGLLLS